MMRLLVVGERHVWSDSKSSVIRNSVPLVTVEKLAIVNYEVLCFHCFDPTRSTASMHCLKDASRVHRENSLCSNPRSKNPIVMGNLDSRDSDNNTANHCQIKSE